MRPLLFESPHSGRRYPDDFRSVLAPTLLRRAEDAYVDQLLGAAPRLGVTRIDALFPRAYVDPNRAEDDLDPALLAGPWPTPLAPGPKTALGIGLVRRVVTPELAIYDRKLGVGEVRHRIEAYWRPYRTRLERLVRELALVNGRLLVVQWHSMKSSGNAATPDGPGTVRPDVVLGDRYGRSAPTVVVEYLRRGFAEAGLSVAVNAPYAGTATLDALTGLAPNVVAVQVELNRALYLDEATVTPHDGFDYLARTLEAVTRDLVDLARAGW